LSKKGRVTMMPISHVAAAGADAQQHFRISPFDPSALGGPISNLSKPKSKSFSHLPAPSSNYNNPWVPKAPPGSGGSPVGLPPKYPAAANPARSSMIFPGEIPAHYVIIAGSRTPKNPRIFDVNKLPLIMEDANQPHGHLQQLRQAAAIAATQSRVETTFNKVV
jgi:hypothetical protein